MENRVILKGLRLMLLTVLVLTGAIAGNLGNVFAASATPATVLPDGTGKKVLFDNTHGQTAGAADWVIDGAFSDFANGLKSAGFSVEELSRQIPYTFGEQAVSYEKLKGYDVFIIGEANIPYKKSEQEAMEQYVREGGSIFFIADHYNADRNKNRWDASEVMNGYRRGAFANPAKGMTTEEAGSPAMQGVESSDWLGSKFGIRFRYNAIGDVTATDIAAPSQSFGITEGVNSVAMHAGSTLAIVDPSKAKGIVYLPKTTARWSSAVDKGVYNGGGREEGPYAAISKLGNGKAAFIGDSSAVEDASPKYLREENGSKKTTYDGYKEQDDGKFLVQTVKWLADKESYTSFDQVPGMQLDQPTKLILDPAQKENEDPATSVEPQAEPWAAPAAGYKWYDPKTFRPGSYGAVGGTQPPPAGQPSYKLVHQNVLPNSQQFQVRVEVDGIAAGSTVSNLNLGVYLTGGTQVAKVQNADGTWPSVYGYSSNFSMTADAKGHASKTLTVQIKPGTSGTANMRIRQGSSTNIQTESVTIGDVPAEPLPDESAAPEVISIQDARKMTDGTLVTVEGTITSNPGVFGGQGFYLQQGSSGIYVYQNTDGFEAGDFIRITAVKKTFNTEVELTDVVNAEKIGSEEIPPPLVQSSVNEENQGTLIKLENVQIKNLSEAGTAGTFEFDAVNEQGTTRVRVDSRTGISFAEWSKTFQEGSVVNITGIASVFKGVYQLKPLSMDHFEQSDHTAPITTAVADGNTGEKYNKVDVTVSFSSDDGNGAGIDKTEYRLNDGEWVTVTGPVVITEEGKNVIDYRSIDKAGNAEEAKSLQIWIDKTAPVIRMNGNLTFYQTDSKIDASITADDNLSGLESVEYILDGKAISSLDEIKPLALSLGEHTFTVTAKDQAGNMASKDFKLSNLMDIDHLDELIALGEKNHAFTKKGIVNSLDAHVKAVQKNRTARELFSLLGYTQAQKGKGITQEFAEVMEESIKYLIDLELN
ncbi:OmpL47-type beta-barrel domain-containing protein [Peribacillus kribbensis]|uniref:OmpL47-type beta-barrel domain-containing protein n=1 Tax=Peribacillus kribbensis TaxID=356658 RepID=UPI000422FD18|nr:hypothetical protein [Peribacillus kribbensis]